MIMCDAKVEERAGISLDFRATPVKFFGGLNVTFL